MTALAELVERCIRSVARDLDRTGYRLCACGCPQGQHTPDSTHPHDIRWCASCGGACQPNRTAGIRQVAA